MSSLRLIIGSCVLAAVVTGCQRKAPADDDHMAHMSAGDVSTPPVNATTSQGDLKLPPSANTAAARVAASPRHAEWVKIAWRPGSKDSLMAWIVYPSTTRAKTPVVVVVHEIFGLSTWVRGVADQVAAEGYIAIAPDLVSRVRGGPSTVELSSDSARKLIAGVDPAERNDGISAAARYAMAQPSAESRYAVIGFCWGGQTVWMHMVNGGAPGLAGGVAFYGLPYMNGAVPNGDSLKKINVPVRLFSGAKDARIGAGMPAVDSAMISLGKDYAGENFAGAVHGFMRAQDDPKTQRDMAEEQANMVATRTSWPKTVAFLKQVLK